MANRYTPETVGSMTEAQDRLADELHALSGNGTAQVTNVTATTRTMTAAEFLSGSFVNNVAGAMALTYPTAAQLVAAFPNVQVGTQVALFLVNTGTSGTLTHTTNTGLTITGGHGTATMPTATSQIMLAKFTNVTVGAEAVLITPFLKTAS